MPVEQGGKPFGKGCRGVALQIGEQHLDPAGFEQTGPGSATLFESFRLLAKAGLEKRLCVTALLRYLAVAHYGRGRGEWRRGEYPAHWKSMIEEEIQLRQEALSAAWRPCMESRDENGAGCSGALAELLSSAARALLARLYPDIRLPT